MEILLVLFAVIVGVPLVALGFGMVWLAWKTVRGIGLLVRHVLVTLKNLLLDTFRCVGALITSIVFLPLIVLNLLLLRFRAARHYAQAFEEELLSALFGVYRVTISHPLRLVGLGVLVEGLERRLPSVVDREPLVPRRRGAGFPGYKVTGSLPSGGSGASLFLARPARATVERWSKAGRRMPEHVVIKSFTLEQGSTLPQIVRESSALEAAERLGLVFDHALEPDRFYYVMEYVQGEELGLAVQRLHAASGTDGLGAAGLERVLGWSRDLLESLVAFHAGGFWHKDVKPSNLIVHGERMKLVDFGLVTPLSSCDTLTTHGTEYYRDPELVRLALQGVKVHEVDGVKFDLYSAGAVIYSMLEDSFPAQGSLSPFAKRSPEALRWIVRRAMAEIGERYPSAGLMLADLKHVAEAKDPWAVLPAELPSSRDGLAEAARAEASRAALSLAPMAPIAAPSARTREPAPLRRRGRRVAAAAGVLGLGCASAMGLIVAGRAEVAHAEGRRHELAAEKSFSRLSPADREALELARNLVADVAEAAERASTSPTPLAKPAARTGPATFPLALVRGIEEPLVILSDVTAPLPSEALERLEQTLAEGGLRVLGSEGDELSPDEELAIAAIHHLAGLDSLHDDAAAARLEAFLEQNRNLGGILWVAAPTEPAEGEPARAGGGAERWYARVVTRKSELR